MRNHMMLVAVAILVIAFISCMCYLFIQNNQLENQIQEMNNTINDSQDVNSTGNNTSTSRAGASSSGSGASSSGYTGSLNSQPTGGVYRDGVSSPNVAESKLDSKDYYTTGTDYYRGSDGNYYYTEFSNGRIVDSGRAYKTSTGQVAKA